MAESVARATAQVTRDLDRLRRVGRWWAGALVLSWVTIVALLGLLLWHWTSPPSTAALLGGVGVNPVFEAEGRTYLLLPQGSQALRCQQGRGQWVPCVALPMETRSTAPSLERMLEQDGAASEAPASGSPAQEPGRGARGVGGRLGWPPTRPEGQPGVQGETRPGTQAGQEG